MQLPETILGGLAPEEFLANYWQKRPLLIRQALPGLRSPITPEELAGLACEEGVTARLSATLFASGEAYELSPELVEVAPLLTGRRPLTAETLRPWLEREDFLELLQTLVHSGILSLIPARKR